jgi:hypothetical protein
MNRLPMLLKNWSGTAGTCALILCCGLLLSAFAPREQPDAARGAEAQPAVRFGSFDVILDTGDSPLAAYQIRIAPAPGQDAAEIRLVGIEGAQPGDPAAKAFGLPPHYDPAALHATDDAAKAGRVIIAAYSTLPAADLPRGKARVARIHLRWLGDDARPRMTIELMSAGDDRAARLTLTASLE